MVNILIVTSEMPYSDGWNNLLRKQGHTIKEVANNQEVLLHLEDFLPDVILCEYRPTESLNCFELAKTLKQDPIYGKYANTGIIGFGNLEYRLKPEDKLLVNNYLQTPASPNKLLMYIQDALN